MVVIEVGVVFYLMLFHLDRNDQISDNIFTSQALGHCIIIIIIAMYVHMFLHLVIIVIVIVTEIIRIILIRIVIIIL